MLVDVALRVAEGFPDAILFVADDGRILAGNRGLQRVGLDAERLVARSLLDVAHAPSGTTASLFQSWLRSRTPLPGALTFPEFTPEVLRCHGHLLEARSDDGPAVVMLRLVERSMVMPGFQALNDKVAALTAENRRRVAIERQLARERNQLETTLRSIGEGVIVTDAAGRVRTLNAVAEVLTGWTQEEALNRDLREVFAIVNEFTRVPVDNPVERVLLTGRIVGLANHTLLIARDGTERPIDDSAAPIRDADGSLHGVVLIFRDITEQKRWLHELEATNAELAEADRRKDEFLAMLAHELRNPLAPLLSGLELLERDPKQVHVLATVKSQVKHLVGLVDDLLDVSHMLRSKISLKREIVSIQDVLQRTLAELAPAIQARSHMLDVELPGPDVLVDGDPVRLVQTFSNLLGNAVKYTPHGGRIEVRSQRHPGEIRIVVRDNGIGIEPDLLPHVFELFTQAEQTMDRSDGGLGIGLTVVRNLVELHGGWVAAQSEGWGHGSEFIVSLPVANAAAVVDPRKSGTTPPSPRRILVVDDNEAAAELLSLLLETLGNQEIRVASDGDDALAQAAAFRPELVILDIGLPKMDGYEVARALRRDERFRETFIVALTGYGSSEDRKRSFEAGFDAHYVKPLSLENLVALLESIRPPAQTA